QNALGAFADLYPYAIFGAGVLLGWRFHRSRLLFALLIITTADRTLVHFAAGHGLGRDHVVFQAIAVLLPLNLAALALTAERGRVPGPERAAPGEPRPDDLLPRHGVPHSHRRRRGSLLPHGVRGQPDRAARAPRAQRGPAPSRRPLHARDGRRGPFQEHQRPP